MKKIISMLIMATFWTFTGCDIERFPYTDLSADEVKKDPEASLDALLNGAYAQLKKWSDVMHRCGEYAGDNIMIRGTSTDAFYEFISYSRTPNNYRLQSFWDNSYKAIAQTSNILKLVDEGINKDIDNKLGECYFIRGFLYFYLCRAYGRPYYQNPETNLGVPIVNGTPDDILGPLPDRSSVQKTYEQAISDLKKAATLITKNNGATYGSREAAWALLSRIYLYMSGTFDHPNAEYAKLAVEYADKVIQSGVYKMLDRADFMKYNTFTPEQNKETIFAIKRVASEFSGWDHYYGIGGMYANIGGMGWGEMYASAKYIALLDETGRNDWANNKIVDARAAFIEPQYVKDGKKVFRFIKKVYNSQGVHTNYNYVQAEIKNSADNSTLTCAENTETYTLTPVDREQGIWSIQYKDGNTYTGVIDPEMKLNRVYPMFYVVKCSREGEDSHLHSPVITRLAEMYLNKAEAAGKLGDYAMALNALNVVRERSLPGKGYDALTAENAEARIEKERTLELAFQAERSYDVYRNGHSLTRHYPGPHNALEEIQPKDYRTVYFIPQNAINAYPEGSKLTQNPTSN
ncbi:RagB/SusD family nutrient uptake outer membrane protein [Tannerella forsythia]|uniref:RagB/SusD family nutrient uptake outer membrane protein n=1 Tax=Tannerella forsythia TaxID=28112 RepID=A0A2A6EB11_TANFO|nr:RagB/SusD family nutrient uptake outer membrane protein [Tannerella forsythia]PDP45218.1 RagB/SusD family nutrient uptake outer membrane protein [Tannerella forsythia]